MPANADRLWPACQDHRIGDTLGIGNAMQRSDHHINSSRKATGKATRSLWTAGLALIVVIVVIAQLNGSLDRSDYARVGVALAVLLLVVRQINRRSRGKGPRAAEPDSRSALHLD